MYVKKHSLKIPFINNRITFEGLCQQTAIPVLGIVDLHTVVAEEQFELI
jgi:hypothetical protein